MTTQPSGSGAIYLLEVMEEIWKRLNPLLNFEVNKVIRSQEHETEHLLLLSERELFRHQRDRQKDITEYFREQLTRRTAFASSDSAEKCVHRFLLRSCKCLQSFVDAYLRELRKAKHGYGGHVALVRSQLGQVQDMAQRLIVTKLKLSPDQGITCPNLDCGSANHFHSVDRLIWLPNQRELEENIPLPSETTITFRDFDLSVLTSEASPDRCFDSLLAAIEKSIKYSTVTRLVTAWWEDEEIVEDLEDSVSVVSLPDALKFVSRAILKHFEIMIYKPQIGIILPGGSQVFWPTKINERYSGSLMSVYVKAQYDMEYDTTKLRFLPVKIKTRPKNAQLTQTVEFEQLPPEIRNMVYGYILDRKSGPNLPRRQPPIALTSRLVHKEVMSLLFQKYGWFVKM